MEGEAAWLGEQQDAGRRWALCMRAGDFAGAWAISDALLQCRDKAEADNSRLPYHLRWVWDGTLPDGRDVLVRCYHGLGDTLQFVRFLPELRARASSVTLELQPELCGLLAAAPGADRVLAFDQAHPLPPAECTIEIMDLGHVLSAGTASIIGKGAYVNIDDRKRGFPAAACGAVGLCWQAGDWDCGRSVTLPALLDAVAPWADCFISLQRGPAAFEAEQSCFVNPCDDDRDVVRTASLIEASRCVVTVDTMVAHLAGAMGKSCILLLKSEPDWRWPAKGEQTTPWYPAMRILHQHRPGDWSGPLELLRRDYRRAVSGIASSRTASATQAAAPKVRKPAE